MSTGQKGVLVTGNTIKIKREDSGWESERQHVWVVPGHIPQEWETLKEDPTVVSATLYGPGRLHGRQKRPSRGAELAHYQRQQEEGGAA